MIALAFSWYNGLLVCALICFLLEGLRIAPRRVSLFPMGFMFVVAAILANQRGL